MGNGSEGGRFDRWEMNGMKYEVELVDYFIESFVEEMEKHLGDEMVKRISENDFSILSEDEMFSAKIFFEEFMRLMYECIAEDDDVNVVRFRKRFKDELRKMAVKNSTCGLILFLIEQKS